MEYKINEEQVNLLIEYLATRPYGEVFQGVSMLQGLDKVEVELVAVEEE